MTVAPEKPARGNAVQAIALTTLVPLALGLVAWGELSSDLKHVEDRARKLEQESVPRAEFVALMRAVKDDLATVRTQQQEQGRKIDALLMRTYYDREPYVKGRAPPARE